MSWIEARSRILHRSFQRTIDIPMSAIQDYYSPMRQCEGRFLNFLGEMRFRPQDAINLWGREFQVNTMVESLRQLPGTAEREQFITELTRFVGKDMRFNNNLANLVTELLVNDLVRFTPMQALFVNRQRQFADVRFFWSRSARRLSAQDLIPEAKTHSVNNFLSSQQLNSARRREYQDILLQSNLSANDIQFAIEQGGLRLRNDDRALLQFREYIDFLNSSTPHRLRSGLRQIELIYDYAFRHGVTTFDPLLPTYKKFLAQRSRLISYKHRRLEEITNGFKTESTELPEEARNILLKMRNGERLSEVDFRRLDDLFQTVELNGSLHARALRRAASETEIYRKILNGCNGEESPHLERARKKFSRFKLGLGVGLTGYVYQQRNQHTFDDEIDRYWKEKFGFELFSAILVTVITNKIMTNTNLRWWQQYFRSFGAFAFSGFFVNNLGYEALFGDQEYARYILNLYSDSPQTQRQIEIRLEELRQSETFEQDLQELVQYLDRKTQETNTMNIINNFFNLNASNSVDDNIRITQEDLETEDAREFLMELISQKIYMENMGEWPLFQTGSHGGDRWLFNRARAIPFNLEGVFLNLALFQIMCRQPFGKVASWGAAFGIALADRYYSDQITFYYRESAINQ